MNRTRWIALAAVVVVLLAGAWLKSRGHKDAPKYRTAALEQGDITATVAATGSVQPVLQVQVGSQVSGTISELHVDYNSRVHAGQVLAQIEPSSFQARVAQAEAAVARAEAALKDGQRQFTRAQELLKGDYVSQADVDAAEVGGRAAQGRPHAGQRPLRVRAGWTSTTPPSARPSTASSSRARSTWARPWPRACRRRSCS